MTVGTFFSPSYIGDLERMVWLRRSIEAFQVTPTRHVIAVPRQDLGAFQNALGRSSEVELVFQEDLVDPCFYPDILYRLAKKFAPGQSWRLDTRAGKPGWIVQQIVKLSSNRLINDGPIIFLDSDLFFYRRFSLKDDLGLHDGKRVLVRINQEGGSAPHRHHAANSWRFFGLPESPTNNAYMAYPAIWYPDWLSQMQQHIESLKSMPWQKALLAVDFNISEYTLYGVFIDEVLKPDNLTVRDRSFDLIAWDRASFDAIRSEVLSGRPLPADKLTLCLQSNLHIPVSEYEDMLQVILNLARTESST
ncbi:MAG: hypothetical protein GZ085_01060 [Sulfuriferula multivorans]|uniref:Nucleotide-diphospho-sugar transferase domain-containing protein n=1 Tax=Sulfuriferula multivorans TaxID=1559896 RepID=A0A7C9NRQ4_9PROT|nr:hypothetical protein [Sulfuriferula multivorans]